jgi:YfiH family protein
VALKSKTDVNCEIGVLRADSLARIPWLVHGFSTRRGGISNCYGGNALNLGYTAEDSRRAVDRNRQAFSSAVLAPPPRAISSGEVSWPMVTTRQIHSDLIHWVSWPPAQPPAGDGLITCTPGLLLAVLTADCFSVILVDAPKKAVGVFHAGWRGTMKRIVEKGVGEMRRRFGSRPSELNAALGPGIRECCYQVGPEVREQFEGRFSYADSLFRESRESDPERRKYPLLFLNQRAPGHGELPNKIFLNLAEANRCQLLDAGITAKNIFDLGLCTSCRPDLFFSYRAEKGGTGRMMAVVGIREIS